MLFIMVLVMGFGVVVVLVDVCLVSGCVSVLCLCVVGRVVCQNVCSEMLESKKVKIGFRSCSTACS